MRSIECDEGEDLVLDVVVGSVIFRDEDTGFTVARMEFGDVGEDGAPDFVDRRFVATGQLLEARSGIPLRIRGGWVIDRKYGRQFKISSYQLREPETLLGIERYLASGIPGIGEKLAREIVRYFGHDAFEVIEFSPDRLSEIPGIGESKRRAIVESIGQRRDLRDSTVFLRGCGIPQGLTSKIIKRYGVQASTVVRANPYRLCEIHGVGFKTADEVALKVGVDRCSSFRVDAALISAMDDSVTDGHMFLTERQLSQMASRLLDLPEDLVMERIPVLVDQSTLVLEIMGRMRCVMLPWAMEAEVSAASKVARMLRVGRISNPIDEEVALDRLSSGLEIDLAPEQREAVRLALTERCVVITGGPGVGKTTIVRAIVQMGTLMQRKIALAAPTGRASRRMSEATGREAVTLHRLLEFKPRDGGFQRGKDNPLEEDLLVVDESSMVDAQLFSALMSALRVDAQLILVGDIDQLPSVGAGAVLLEIIESGVVPVVRLTKIFRQAAESRIVVSAHAINRGDVPDLEDPGADVTTDFHFVESDDPNDAAAIVADLAGRWIPERMGFDARSQVQVLTPMHAGVLGTTSLNRRLQDLITPADGVPFIERGEQLFRRGDKVMQLKNDYDRGVFNGDIGLVSGIDAASGVLEVNFEGRLASYARAELGQLVLAYAISIHKSQGSEYPAVVIPVSTQHWMMLKRSLLYTGITRGKKLVMVVGSRRAIEIAVKSVDASRRNTNLAIRLRQQMAATSEFSET